MPHLPETRVTIQRLRLTPFLLPVPQRADAHAHERRELILGKAESLAESVRAPRREVERAENPGYGRRGMGNAGCATTTVSVPPVRRQDLAAKEWV